MTMAPELKKILWAVVGAICVSAGLAAYNATVSWAEDLVHMEDLNEVQMSVNYLIAEAKVEEYESRKKEADHWSTSDERMLQHWINKKLELELALFGGMG
jgi:hypothetical protein